MVNLNEINQAILKQKEKEARLTDKYGKVKPVIYCKFNEFHIIAVGNTILFSNKWKTFPDFLFQYLWHLLGKEWIISERKKGKNQHIILQWSDYIIQYQKSQTKDVKGIYKSNVPGPFKALITLAYDLYILSHHMKLQNSLIKRLKNTDQFQGARYELFVFANLIRNNLKIEYEDEDDRNTKHVELFASNELNKEIIAIEAKSKHRPGIMGFNQSSEISQTKTRVGKLLNKAISKKPSSPYFIFIDLNLSPDKILLIENDPKLKEFIKATQNIQTHDGKDLFNAIFFTNFPYHYKNNFAPAPDNHLSIVISQRPKFKLKDTSLILELSSTIKKYGQIPNEFSEYDKDL